MFIADGPLGRRMSRVKREFGNVASAIWLGVAQSRSNKCTVTGIALMPDAEDSVAPR